MSRSDDVYLLDILESINIILTYTENKTEFDFVNDLMLQDAVIRCFEIIGEAATKISEQIKNAAPAIQWKLMKAMRINSYMNISEFRQQLFIRQ